MGRKLDKVKTGVGVTLATVTLWDRVWAFFSKRKRRVIEEAKEEARQEALRRLKADDIDFQRISDEAGKHRPRCEVKGCKRPQFHEGEHGETP